MKDKLKFCLVVFLYLFLVLLADHHLCYARGGRDFVSMPGPTLLYPATENIDLKSGPFLEFRWERVNTVWADHYDFKLYKGYQTMQANLLVKKQLSTDDYPFKLDAANLEVNQVYTWSLTQVYSDGKKSDRAFASFTIIKK